MPPTVQTGTVVQGQVAGAPMAQAYAQPAAPPMAQAYPAAPPAAYGAPPAAYGAPPAAAYVAPPVAVAQPAVVITQPPPPRQPNVVVVEQPMVEVEEISPFGWMCCIIGCFICPPFNFIGLCITEKRLVPARRY